MENREIQAVLEEIAAVLELKGTNAFKVRAYENAARAIGNLQEEVALLIEEQRLGKVRGIGKSIQAKLEELVATGELTYLNELKADLPGGLLEIMDVPGVGPKKTRVLWEELGVQDLASLEQVCKDGKVAKLKDFGQKTQDKILGGIARLALTRGRRLRSHALPYALELAELLRAVEGVERVDIAGSLRRGRETVKDADVLVAAADAKPVMAAVVAYPEVEEVIGSGETKTSVQLQNGLNIDVRVVAPRSFACALAYFTGSKEFNVALRQLALEQGYSLNEYDLNPLDGSPPPELETEADLHRFLGLDYIPPELRENTGEIAAAQQHELPTLLEPDDLVGILHVHTTWSDGAGTVDEMVAEAEALGYAYVGISDHSQAAHYANGLDPARLAAQREEIEAARAAHPGIRVLHGVECDILPDGSLDLPDDCLEQLEFVIASVHTALGMEREKMTARLVKAVSHPLVRVLGHPLGRKLQDGRDAEREASQFDWEQVLDACQANDVAVEVNGHPRRLDADWIHIRRIRARGVKLCVNPDAHSQAALDHARRYGVTEARRGWATRDDVVNALPLERFEQEFLRREPSKTPAAKKKPAKKKPAAKKTAKQAAKKKAATKKKAASRKKAAAKK